MINRSHGKWIAWVLFFELPITIRPPTQKALIFLKGFQEDPIYFSLDLASFSISISLLTELSKPCTLSLTNMHKNTEHRENKEVSRWMSHPKHRITNNYYLIIQSQMLLLFYSFCLQKTSVYNLFIRRLLNELFRWSSLFWYLCWFVCSFLNCSSITQWMHFAFSGQKK